MQKTKNASTNEITMELYNMFLQDRQHEYAVHNTQSVLSYCGESDFISVNKSGNIIEVEVKISRADFKNDFTKKNRHEHLKGKAVIRRNHYAGRRNYELKHPVNQIYCPNGLSLSKKLKWYSIECFEMQSLMTYDIPNYFYFAIPEGVVKIDDIPLYCGVLFAKVQEYQWKGKTMRNVVLYEARKPKKLTDRKVDDKQVHAMLRCQSFKWTNRLRKEQ